MSGSLFTPDTWEEATETVTSSLPGGTRYGLGLTTRDYLGIKGYGHGGDLGGYTTQAFYFPEKDISIVVCGNDARINSWFLTNTVSALLQAFIDCEAIISSSKEPALSQVELSVFPNPFYEQLTIVAELESTVNESHFTITDILGKLVWSSTKYTPLLDSGIMLTIDNISDLNPGLYFLNTYLDGQIVKSNKILKER